MRWHRVIGSFQDFFILYFDIKTPHGEAGIQIGLNNKEMKGGVTGNLRPIEDLKPVISLSDEEREKINQFLKNKGKAIIKDFFETIGE